MSLSREKDKEVRRAGFLTFWFSKFLFSKFPRYGIKFALFPLAISLARGAQYPLAPMFLGHVYSQLDQLHGDEAEGDSCYVITSSLHCAILQVLMWDCSSVTLSRCRNLKFVKDKFQGSPNVVKGLCVSSTDSHPIIFRWLSLKGNSLDLVELLTRQVICIGVLPGSLAPVLFVTLYYLPFLLLQETRLICVVVTRIV